MLHFFHIRLIHEFSIARQHERARIVRDQTSVISVSATGTHMANLHIQESRCAGISRIIWASQFVSRLSAIYEVK